MQLLALKKLKTEIPLNIWNMYTVTSYLVQACPLDIFMKTQSEKKTQTQSEKKLKLKSKTNKTQEFPPKNGSVGTFLLFQCTEIYTYLNFCCQHNV